SPGRSPSWPPGPCCVSTASVADPTRLSQPYVRRVLAATAIAHRNVSTYSTGMPTALPTMPLGRTDMHLSRVGFGAWAAGGGGWAFGWGPQDDDESVRAIVHAVEHGVNWVDTAAVYGLGHSERVTGAALKALPEGDRPYVFTK